MEDSAQCEWSKTPEREKLKEGPRRKRRRGGWACVREVATAAGAGGSCIFLMCRLIEVRKVLS